MSWIRVTYWFIAKWRTQNLIYMYHSLFSLLFPRSKYVSKCDRFSIANISSEVRYLKLKISIYTNEIWIFFLLFAFLLFLISLAHIYETVSFSLYLNSSTDFLSVGLSQLNFNHVIVVSFFLIKKWKSISSLPPNWKRLLKNIKKVVPHCH